MYGLDKFAQLLLPGNALLGSNRRIIRQVVGKDTMNLEFYPPSGIHIFIDSIPFSKGNFVVNLGFSDDNDSLIFYKWSKYIDKIIGLDSAYLNQHYYKDFVNDVGVDFISYFNKNVGKVELYKKYCYCHSPNLTTESRLADEFIKDVLKEKYVSMSIINIECVDHIRV